AVISRLNFDAPPAPHHGTYFVWGNGPYGGSGNGANPAGVAQRIDLSAHAAGIDHGDAEMTFRGWGAGLGPGLASACLEVRFFGAAAGGNQIGSALVSNRAEARGVWTEMLIHPVVPAGTRGVELRVMAQRPAGFYGTRAGFDDVSAQMF